MARTPAAFAAWGAPPSATALMTSFSRVSGAIGSSSSRYCVQEGGGGLLRKYSAGAQQLRPSRLLLQEQRRILQWLLTSPSLGEQHQQQEAQLQHQVGSHYLCGGRLSSSERAALTRERLRHRLQQGRCFSAAASASSETKHSRTPVGSQGGGTESSSKTSGPRQYDSSTGQSDTAFSYSKDPEKQRKVLEAVRRGDAEPSGPGYTFKGTPLQPDEFSPERLEKLQQGDTSYYTAAPEDVAAHEAARASVSEAGASTKHAASEIGAAGARILRENTANMTEKVKQGAGAVSTAAKENLSGAAQTIKEGATAAKDTMKEKATGATDTVREGAAATGRALRNTASRSAATAGAAAAAFPGGSRFANASLGSKLLLAGGAGLLLYSLWGGCSLMRETDALRTAWDYIKKDEQVKAQMGMDFTRERWWGGFEHEDAARVKLRLRGRHGEKGLAVCDLTREHPKAPWKVLGATFVRTDNSASRPSSPQRQQVPGSPPPSSSSPSQQQQPAQPQHLQEEQPQGAPQQKHLEEERGREQCIAEEKKQQQHAQKQGAQQQLEKSNEEGAAQERQRKEGEEEKPGQEEKKEEPQELQRKADDEGRQRVHQAEIEAQERQRQAEKKHEEKQKRAQKQEGEIQQRHAEEMQQQQGPAEESKGQRVRREREDKHQKAQEDQQRLRREDRDTQQRHRVDEEVVHRGSRRKEEEMHDHHENEREATTLKAQKETAQQPHRTTKEYDERRHRQEQESALQHRSKAKEGQRQYQHPGTRPEDVEWRQDDAVRAHGQQRTDLQEQHVHEGETEVPSIAQAHGEVPQRVEGGEKHTTEKEGTTQPAHDGMEPLRHKGHGRTLEVSRQPRERCAVPRNVPGNAFTPPIEEQKILPWKVKAMQRDASLQGKSDWGSGPVPPPGPYTRP